MTDRNAGVIADPLFVGATRPPMVWGVTYSAVMMNAVCVMELFLTTKNLLTLLIAAPIHGVCMLLCARDARYFDLMLLCARTRVRVLPMELKNESELAAALGHELVHASARHGAKAQERAAAAQAAASR